jgi:hypothetical protein
MICLVNNYCDDFVDDEVYNQHAANIR